MRVSQFLIGGWMVLIVLILPHAAWGSCPRPGPVPTAYKRAALVFVGEVETIQPEAGPTRSGVITRVAFRVIEMFKGTRTERVTLVLWPSSEEFGYSTGQRVLVYANRDRGFWSTACTRTKQIAAQDPELKELGALRGEGAKTPAGMGRPMGSNAVLCGCRRGSRANFELGRDRVPPGEAKRGCCRIESDVTETASEHPLAVDDRRVDREPARLEPNIRAARVSTETTHEGY